MTKLSANSSLFMVLKLHAKHNQNVIAYFRKQNSYVGHILTPSVPILYQLEFSAENLQEILLRTHDPLPPCN